VVLRYERRRNW